MPRVPGRRRRPQVAGLRKRAGGKPSPRPRPTPYSAQQEDLVESAAREHDVPEAEQPVGEVGNAPERTAETAARTGAETEVKPRPTPRPKARDSGTAMPASQDEVEPAAELAEPDQPAQEAIGSRSKALWTAVVLAVVLAIAAGVLAWQYFSATGLTENQAQTDPVATSQAKKEIGAAVEALFTYDYRELDGRDDEVNELLASDKLRKQFATLNCAVREQAPKQKLATVTKVSYSAITELSGDTARALVFVDNVWERKSSKQKAPSAGSLGVRARLVDDRWKITDLEVHGGTAGAEPEVPAECR